MKTFKLIYVVLLVAFVSSCTVESVEETDGAYQTFEYHDNNINLENEIFSYINSHRSKIGVPLLTKNRDLQTYADDHTEYMIKEGALSHDFFEGRAANINDFLEANGVGENVAKGYTSSYDVFIGWIESPEHLAAIENPEFTQSIVTAKADENGVYYFTQIFIVK